MAASDLNPTALRALLLRTFLSEKAPYAVTLFFAALGFTANQTMDRYNKGPTIEYSIEKTAVLGDVVAAEDHSKPASGATVFLALLPPFTQAGYILKLENISQSYIVKCARVELMLLPRPGGPAPVISNWTTSTSAATPVRRLGAETKERPAVTALDMQPGQWMEIRLNAANVGDVSVVPSPCPAEGRSVAAMTTEVPTMVPRSIVTLFSKHAMKIFWLGIFVWAALLVVIFFARSDTGAKRGEV